ncbi:ATP-binding protein [Collimonas sp. H4R21]|uniref:ATP-binding protein n=1 Tax=Collimonas rhizosphaerae TaxID=3126357 RepID=A0ABU9PWL2_9BURK
MSVIFLAGVHGVGKGYLGAPVAATLEMVHHTASRLIREEKGHATWGDRKLVADIEDNQLALIHAVDRRRKSESHILLDGHFVLRSTAGDFVKLAADVFSSLRLSGVILLCDSPELIANRLFDRDGYKTAPDEIAELAAEEAKHAHDVCSALGIPLIVIESPDEALLRDAIKRLLNAAAPIHLLSSM